MIKEFREFIFRGNVMDLAVAVVIGAAFTNIINSLVNDILMPIIGLLLGGVDFTTLQVQVGDVTIAYGNFIQAIVNFLIIALFVFLIVRSANRVMRRFSKAEEAVPAAPTPEVALLTEIRDLLKSSPR